jgi:hypothetical protein
MLWFCLDLHTQGSSDTASMANDSTAVELLDDREDAGHEATIEKKVTLIP